METTMTGNTLVIRKDETSNESIKLDYVAIKTAAMTLRAINHKLRQQIVRLLEEHKRMNVTDIYVKLRLEQSVASQHLAILRTGDAARLVRKQRLDDRPLEIGQLVTAWRAHQGSSQNLESSFAPRRYPFMS